MAANRDGNLLGHLQDVHARRQAAFWRAVDVLRCDLRQSRLLERLADRADGSGWIEITVEEMAADRAWLLGSRAKAYGVVRWAMQLELVTQERAVIVEGDERRARVRWSLRWDRIEQLAACPCPADASPPRGHESTAWTPVHAVDASPPHGHESTAWTASPIPAGETPHARATGTGTTADIPPPAVETVGTVQAIPPVAEADGQAVKQATLCGVCPRLWRGRPEEKAGITAKNDQRLAYQLGRLLCDPAHRAWVERLLDAAAAEARKPAAFVMHALEDFCAGGRRLMRSIHVPGWAHCDPRDWCPNGDQVQRE